MGVATAAVGYVVYKLVAATGRYSRPLIVAGTFAAAWISVMVAALLTSLQLVVSETPELNVVLPAMMGVHALIGIGEGLISAGAVALVLSARPDLLNVAPDGTDSIGYSSLSGERTWMKNRRNWTILIVAGVGLALLITLFSPFASSNPDGLKRVAEDQEFIHAAEDPSYEIIPDYTFPGVENERLATVLSGIAGVLIVAAIGPGAGYGMRALARSRGESNSSSTPRSTQAG